MNNPILINSPCRGLAQLGNGSVVPFIVAPEFPNAHSAAMFDFQYFSTHPGVLEYARTATLAEMATLRSKAPSPGDIDMIVALVSNIAPGQHCRDYFILPRKEAAN